MRPNDERRLPNQMTAPLWTWTDLVAAGGGEADGVPTMPLTGFSIDTRSLVPGDVFVALKDQRDGHDFVTSAFKAGAAAAIVSRHYARIPGDGALLRADDPLRALEAIGRAARARLSPEARVVAVTGSAGKTGTKEMLRAAFARLGGAHASEKSYNNHWGVPLTLARMPADVHYAVFEIGMNHAGEIRPLTAMVRPHAAIVTTVEAVHLEHFPSVEAIADAKSEVFEGLVPGGAAIIKYDNPHRARLVEAARRAGATPVTFGFDATADVAGERLELTATGSTMTVRTPHALLPVTLSIAGRHIAENALAVVAAVDAVGADTARAVEVLAKITPPGGRGARELLKVAGGEALLIDESYNANPASMRAALMTLATVPREQYGRRVAVLGDMLELGPDAGALHSGLKAAVEESGVDLIFACGPHMKGLYDAVTRPQKGGWAMKASDLEPVLRGALRPGDAIMIKASNGTRLGPVVEMLKAEFGKDAALR